MRRVDRGRKIELAPTTRLEAVKSLWPRFCAQILGYHHEEVYITDLSRVSDFRDRLEPSKVSWLALVASRVHREYGVDLDDREVIVEVLEHLKANGVNE